MGIVEGDYNTWTHKWTNDFPDGIPDYEYQDHYIDDKNNRLYLVWKDNSSKARFGIFNLSDFSTIFLSPSGSYYIPCLPYATSKHFTFGSTLCDCGFSHSIQSYMLLDRADHVTIEAWRGGSTYLWSHNIQTDVSGVWPYCYSISPTGKYICVITYSTCKIVLYEGSYV